MNGMLQIANVNGALRLSSTSWPQMAAPSSWIGLNHLRGSYPAGNIVVILCQRLSEIQLGPWSTALLLLMYTDEQANKPMWIVLIISLCRSVLQMNTYRNKGPQNVLLSLHTYSPVFQVSCEQLLILCYCVSFRIGKINMGNISI